jgi:hypothetical protein
MILQLGEWKRNQLVALDLRKGSRETNGTAATYNQRAVWNVQGMSERWCELECHLRLAWSHFLLAFASRAQSIEAPKLEVVDYAKKAVISFGRD